jgi:hypothetical protein
MGVRSSAAAVAMVAAVLAAVLAGVGVSGCTGGAASPGHAPGEAPGAVVSAPPAATAPRTGSAMPEPPVAVTLPNGVTVPVRAVSTASDGVLDVPPRVGTAGWWRGGSRLGDPFGSTLLAGHVDSVTEGLGPFAALLGVRPGDRIRLHSRHLRQTFAVRSLRVIPRSSFDSRPWLQAAWGSRRLAVVTCAGPYDAARGGYQSLAVVIAIPVGGPAVRGGG